MTHQHFAGWTELEARIASLPTFTTAADLQCWLRADLHVDEQRGCRIRDLTRQGRNFANGLVAESPVRAYNAINGHPTLNFDGSNDILLNGIFGGGVNLAGALVGGDDKAFTLFFALETISVPVDPDNSDLFTAINSSGLSVYRFGYTDSNFFVLKRGSGAPLEFTGGSGLSPGFHIITVIHNGTSTTVRLDGADDWTIATDVDALTGLDLCGIGRSTGSANACHIKLAEFIAADTAFDGTEVNEVEDYLEARYIP